MPSESKASCPFPPRSSIHRAAELESPVVSYSRTHRRKMSAGARAALRWSGATATTGMLAAVLVGPALATTTTDTADSDKVTGTFGAEDSWSGLRTSAEKSSADLQRDPAAASRARLRVPIEVSPCVAEVDAAANGSRDMVVQSQVYMPLREGSYTESSPFGYRLHPVLGHWKLHEGDDFAAAAGTPIYAAADGTVVTAQWDDASGFYVEIKHTMADGSEYTTAYLHQWQQDVLVSVGEEVKAGQQIGAVGNAGRSTGAHLHFEVHDASGTPIDPSAWLAQQGARFLGEDC